MSEGLTAIATANFANGIPVGRGVDLARVAIARARNATMQGLSPLRFCQQPSTTHHQPSRPMGPLP